jgi:hypothetical protein
MVTAADNPAKWTGTNVFSDKEWPFRFGCEWSCFQEHCCGSRSSFSEGSPNSVIRCNKWRIVISSDSIDSSSFRVDRELIRYRAFCRFERSQEMFRSITVHSPWQWTTHIVFCWLFAFVRRRLQFGPQSQSQSQFQLQPDHYNRECMIRRFDGWQFKFKHCWIVWWNEWSLCLTIVFGFNESISLSEPTNTSQHSSFAFTSHWKRRCLTEFVDRT